jgi:hypothetical protein
MYRKELSKMHERVRRYLEICNDMKTRFDDIQRLDYIKAELMRICPNMPFRAILDNQRFSTDIESIFDMPMTRARDEYDRLLAKRNKLVHPYTIDGWNRGRHVIFDRLRTNY